MTSKTYSLPTDFLSSPASKPTKTIVDVSKIMGREYANSYVAVIDNAFTLAECTQLLHAAGAHADGIWEQAMINVGNDQQELATDVRDCGRLIWDDHALVEKIWSRIKYLVPEIHVIQDQPGVTGWWPVRKKETMVVTRLNERMRFLKYGKGQYFRPHYDGTFRVPGGDEQSLYTLHLYLNGVGDDSAEGKLEGGATTFHSDDGGNDFGVDPKVGRVLIFQHRGLMHSGADVLGGLKYTLRTDLMYKVEEE